MSPEFGKRRLLNQMFNKAKTKSLLTNVASKAIVNKIFGFMTGNFVIVIHQHKRNTNRRIHNGRESTKYSLKVSFRLSLFFRLNFPSITSLYH